MSPSSFEKGSLWIERTAWVAGVVLLSMYGGMRLWAEESRAQAIEEFRANAAAPADQTLWSQKRVTAYAEAQKAGDAPQALLRIPQLTLDVPVYGDTSDLNLDRGAGHIPGTANLAEAGNTGIAAHRDGFFRKLKDVELGMDIFIERGGKTLKYHITETHRDAAGERSARAHRQAERYAGHLLPVLLCRIRAEAIHRARRA
jgi:sortase A